ncbi:hypothetical protein KP509_16G072300 [Ceratopteris richardii]|nr:hypothetical protein KP509_16G072300 [Ceratopteris richardii]
MIGTALVDMYAKCGALDKAQAVFDEFPIRALATWNALLFGYAEQGLLNETLSLFQHMQEEGLSPDAITYVCMLKVCTNARSIERGIEIHTELSKKHMLENNVIIGTALIEMYANCGALDKAQEVFDKLQKKDVACWTALIGGFARHGIGDKSINCYIRMQEEGFSPSAITLVFVLSACGSSQAIEMGQLVHAEIRKQRAFAENTLIANALVDMYFKCSNVQKAKEVFDEIPIKITGSWNTLITGYVDHGLAEEALKCFENMQDNGFLPDAITFICSLKACSELKALEKGEKVHAEVSKLGLLKNHIVLGNALVDMYIKCNMLERAKEVFEKVLSRDVTSWNVLIAGYAQHKFNDKAMECFGQMLSEGISPNSITFQSALKACGSVGALQKGKELHGRVGMISSCNRINGLVNALMDMYAQCGAFENAWELFRELQTRDVASWNILISGYVQHGFGSEALDCFARMKKDDVFPNVVTYVNILKACSAIGEVKKGEEIHMEIERLGLLNEHYILGTALVDMYAKHGLIEKSQEVFDKLLLRDAVCWTALINGYAQLGLGDEALCRYGQMQDEGVFPETVTYACILKACSTIGALKRAEAIHSEVGRMGLLEKDSMLGNALLDMYVKCGEISRAQEVFSMLPMRDAFSWTSLISGYAQFGEYRSVFSLFRKMEKEQIEYNHLCCFAYCLQAFRPIGGGENMF